MNLISGGSALAILSIILFNPNTSEARRGGFLSALLHAGGHVATHSAAHAAGSALSHSSRPTPTKTYGPDYLTPSQLEGCIIQAKALDEEGTTIDARASVLKTSQEEIKSQKTKLEADRASLARANRYAVDRFNAQIDSFNERADHQRNQVEAYRAVEAKFNLSVNSYNTNCVKKYYSDDMNTIKAKLSLN